MSFNKNKLPIIATVALLLLLTPTFSYAEANFVEETIYKIINGFLGLFVGLAGFLLNNSIQYTIIDFGRNYLDSGIGAAVESTWVIIRDLFNLTFIFGLIYIGFKMILNSDDSNSRRWLASLIMAALLVNFSLFITKTIVDFTNILATQIVVNGFSTATITGTGDVDISGTFMNNFGLTSLFKASIPTTASPWGFIFGTAIVFIVCMFVFAAGAILLFIRFGALLLYMIFSPLMFIGWVFPQLQKETDKYWQGFLGRAFFAPIYVLLLYVSAKVIFGVYGGKTPNYGDATSGVAGDVNASFVNTFPPFIIGCIFLIASIQVASKLGVDGAGVAMKAGDKFKGYVKAGVGGATVGAAARVSRNTVGQRSHLQLNNQEWMAKNSKTKIGRARIKAAQGLSNASFDVRGTGLIGKELGTGIKGGFSTKIKEETKKRDDFAKSLGKVSAGSDEHKEAVREALEKNDTYKESKKEEAILKEKLGQAEAEKAAINKKINESREPLLKKIADLEEAREKNKVFGMDDPDIVRQLEQEKSKLAGIDTKYSEEMASAETQLKSSTEALVKIGKDIANIEKGAASEAIYSRQINYANQLEESSNWGISKMLKSAGSGGLLGGLVLGASGGLVGGAALGVSSAARATSYKASANSIREKYSNGGKKAEELEKQQKMTALISDQIRELNENSNSPKVEKSDENKSDKS